MTLMTQINAAMALLATQGKRATHLVLTEADHATMIDDMVLSAPLGRPLTPPEPIEAVTGVRTPWGDLIVQPLDPLTTVSGIIWTSRARVGDQDVVNHHWAPLTASDPA